MKILVFLALLSTSFFSQAKADNGNTLLANCQVAVDFFDGKEPKSMWKAHQCLAYITGLVDMNSIYLSGDFKKKDKKYFCLPEGVTSAQNVRVVLNSLKENPQNLHESRFVLVLFALKEAFPCKV